MKATLTAKTLTQWYTRFCDNDETALKLFYEKRNNRLYVYITRINRNIGETNDGLFINTVYRLWVACKKYNGCIIKWSYLFQQAKWAYLDTLKASDTGRWKKATTNAGGNPDDAKNHLSIDDIDLSCIQDKQAKNPEESLVEENDRKITQAVFKKAYQQLSKKQRDVVHLWTEEKYTYDQIAKILEIEEETVHSRLRYAKKNLRRLCQQLLNQRSGDNDE